MIPNPRKMLSEDKRVQDGMFQMEGVERKQRDITSIPDDELRCS